MISIVLVEDDENMLLKLKQYVSKFFVPRNEVFEIKVFTGYNSNLEKIINDTSQRKIYFLDINLGDSVSGIDIARLIRLNDWESEIIFLTNHDKMFETAYRKVYNVFDFIEKFLNMEEKIKKDLSIICNKKYDKKTFCYSNRKIDLQIYLKDITYIQYDSHDRKAIINTSNNQYLVSLPLKQIITMLDYRFKYVHRACIVNKERVYKYNWAQGFFVLDNGLKIYLLSKKYKKSVKK